MVSVRCIEASSRHLWHVMKGSPAGTRSSSLFLFEGPDLVPHPGCRLIILGRDGPLQIVAELDQCGLMLAVTRGPFGYLARVPRFLVDVLQKRHQLVAKHLIVIRTAQPPRIAKFEESDVADRTRLLVGGRRFARGGRAAANQLFGQFPNRQIVRYFFEAGLQMLTGVFVAEMKFTRFAAFDIGDVVSGLLGALLASHHHPPPVAEALLATPEPPGAGGLGRSGRFGVWGIMDDSNSIVIPPGGLSSNPEGPNDFGNNPKPAPNAFPRNVFWKPRDTFGTPRELAPVLFLMLKSVLRPGQM